jgi:CRISPR-associated endonuclease Csn1
MPLQLALDVGHSSLGWAVLENQSAQRLPELRGCGVVLFEKDSALAIQRRGYRQQRRHVRATRQRIRRLELLLKQIGALTPQEIAARHGSGTGHPAPWQLAARVLASSGKHTLRWPEFWSVLRWYAHNRGYEPWGERDENDPDTSDDTEKEARAREAMHEQQTHTMCETVCRWLGVDPFGNCLNTHDPAKNLRQQKAAFPREIVRAEVRSLLEAHRGKLAGVDDAFITALMDEARALPLANYKLPRRYQGGLLFGRLQMRYDNRIISRCVHTAAARYATLRSEGVPEAEARARAERQAKVPTKKCPEFLRYRWAMLLATIRIATTGDTTLRALKKEERETLHALMTREGRLTKTALRDALRALPGWERDDLANQFLHPEAERALLLDPVADLIASNPRLAAVWPILPEQLQNRTRNRWWRIDSRTGLAHATTLVELRTALPTYGGDVNAFDTALAEAATSNTKAKGRRRAKPAPDADPLAAPLHIRRHLANLKGRAAYARPLLEKAFAEVMAGGDPKTKGGCLEETDAIKAYREGRPFDQQTNNHLLRHRLLILSRLLRDLIADPAFGAGNAKRFDHVTIEVNRELRDYAGKNSQEIFNDLKDRLKSHGDAVAWLEGSGITPSGSLIRKARVALDLGRVCPYTGEPFEAVHLREGQVDLDHIIPRSIRPSDSLDSLAITFPAVNRWKGARTAWQFIQECGGQSVPKEHLQATGETRRLEIMPPKLFAEHIRKLDTKGHEDDRRRKSRRKEFFLLETYAEKERDFTPGQLTQTSQLVSLARIATRRALPHLAPHKIVVLPGVVTGAVRKSWQLMGCLADVTRDVLDVDGELRSKAEIRGITHLHHAVDAATLAYAHALLPSDGAVLARLVTLLQRRKIPAPDRDFLRSLLPLDIDGEGRWQLKPLPEATLRQLRERLKECRVVQHVPADMGGVRLEQNTWRVERVEEDRVFLRQKSPRNAQGMRQAPFKKRDEIEVAKAFGLRAGRLRDVQGVRVLAGNFGIAVLNAPTVPEADRIQIVRHNRVWETLKTLRKLNAGSPPILFRAGALIDVPTGSRKGRWRITSIKKSEAFGISFDLATADGTKLAKGNAPVTKLLQDGMVLVKTNYAGSAV